MVPVPSLTSGDQQLTLGTDGTVTFPGYKFPAQDGTTGQVLATYGNSVIYWSSTGGGGSGATRATGPAGSGFVWQGAWDPQGSYIQDQDVVSYGGGSYIKIGGDGNSGARGTGSGICHSHRSSTK